MIVHLYIKPSTIMDNSPRESLGKENRDETFSLSANIDTNWYRLEWENEAEKIYKVTKRLPLPSPQDVQ